LWNDRALQAQKRGAATKIEQGANGPCYESNPNGSLNVIFPSAGLTSQPGSRVVARVEYCSAGGESALAYKSIELSSDVVRPELDGH
jgi:hypothetical protein